MRFEPLVASRRAALLAACTTLLTPLSTPAADEFSKRSTVNAVSGIDFKGGGGPAEEFSAPTYSLKGLANAITGADKPPPADLGVIGRGADNQKTGRLNACNPKSGCISSFSQADTEEYVPPWTYQDYTETGASSFASRKDELRAQARAEAAARAAEEAAAAAEEAIAAGLPPPPPPPPPSQGKSLDTAFGELKAAVEKGGGKIQKAGDRYIYAEFTADNGVVDDVEFLFSKDKPLVGYRSAARAGTDDKRQRGRVRDIRKSLSGDGWKSVGRLNMD